MQKKGKVYTGRVYTWLSAFLFVLLAITPLLLLKEEKQSFSDVSVVNQKGITLKMGDVLEKRPAVVNTWASWCPFCTEELPDFERLQKEFPEVVVVLVNRNESKEVAERFAKSVGGGVLATYVYDTEDAWYKSIQGYVMPETVFINAKGDVVKHVRGPLSFEEMKKLTQELIAGANVFDELKKEKGCNSDGTSCRL